jgi:hypothetical protein
LEIMLEKKQKIAIEYVAHLLRGIILCDRWNCSWKIGFDAGCDSLIW